MTFTDKPIMSEDPVIMDRIAWQSEWLAWFYASDSKDFIVTQLVEWLTKEQLNLAKRRTIQAGKL